MSEEQILQDVKVTDKSLQHPVLANPVIHRGSNDCNLPRAPTPGDIRSMFGTNISSNGQPEYTSSPTTMVDPSEWNSFLNSNVQLSRSQSSQDLDLWANDTNNTSNCSKQSKGQNVNSSNTVTKSLTPKNSESSFNIDDFIKTIQSDEVEIKTEIEKIFEPFSDAQTDHKTRKKMVGKILQNLISKFGLLRIYTTLKMVEDELSLQTKEQCKDKENTSFESIIQNEKIHITEISSNENVMKRMSADILHALFLNNKIPSRSSLDIEKNDESFYDKYFQTQTSNSDVMDMMKDASQQLNGAKISKDSAPKMSGKNVKNNSSLKTKQINSGKQSRKRATVLSVADPNKAINGSQVSHQATCTNKANLSIELDKKKTLPLSKLRAKEREIPFVLSIVKKNAEKQSPVRNAIQESRLKLRKQNQMHVTKGQTQNTNVKTDEYDGHTICLKKSYSEGHINYEKEKQSNEDISVFEDEEKRNISEKDCNGCTTFPESKMPTEKQNQVNFSVRTESNSCFTTHKAVREISSQTDPMTVEKPIKWMRFMIIILTFLFLFGCGYVYLTETWVNLPHSKETISHVHTFTEYYNRIKSFYLS